MDAVLEQHLRSSSTEDTVRQLFKFFCNNLYLGQFELARACIQSLHTEAFSSDIQLSDIITDIVEYPYSRSVTSTSVSSPILLSWMCHLEQKHLDRTSNETGTADDPVRHDIEFHFLLLETCANATDEVLKELYVYYRWIHSEASQQQTQLLTLSSSLLKFLCTCLLQTPSLGHALIQSLKVKDTSLASKNSKALYMVYINAINGLLDKLSQTDLGEEFKSESSSKLKEILSLFDPPKDTTGLPLRQLFFKVLECCQQKTNYLNKQTIFGLLFGETGILEEFCRIDYESETNNAVATYQTCADLMEEQRCLLHLSSLPEYSARLQMFFLLSIKNNRHFLEATVETCIRLIQSGMFEELSKLLGDPDLQPLKPLLLLLGWTHCYTITEARRLLDTLWNDQVFCQHPAIAAGCNKLAYQIDLIQWCLDKTKPLVSESGGSKQLQAADIFKRLENHSVLYVLHQSTQLSALDFQEVLDLLQKTPLQKDAGVEKDKKIKCVRFEDEKPEVEDDKGQGHMISLDQRKDIAIYTAYCILELVMETIMFCCNSADERLLGPSRLKQKQKRLRVSSGSGSDLEPLGETDEQVKTPSVSKQKEFLEPEDSKRSKTSGPDLQTVYNENVTDKLQRAKTFLAKLQPLTFRTEILEDVFSLLFVTHEDIQEAFVSSEYETEDEVTDRSRQASSDMGTPCRSPSKENIFSGRASLTAVIEVADTNRDSVAYDEPFIGQIVKSRDLRQDNNVDMSELGKKLEEVQLKISAGREKLNIPTDGRRSSFSENMSSYSTTSSGGLGCFGFMVNEYLARDILAMLKECLVDLQAAKFHVLGKSSDSYSSERQMKSRNKQEHKQAIEIDITIEQPLCCLVKSTVTTEMLQKRISQLSQFVSEAQWRFQLVSHDLVPKHAGEILVDPVETSRDSSEEEIEIIGRSHKSSRKRKLTGRKSPRTDRDQNKGNSDSSDDASSHKRSKVRSHGVARSHSSSSPIRNQGIVWRMLSSPVTLLNMSIRKGNFNQTKQIIKLCKLEDRPESVEVWFCQAYVKACRSVQGMTGTSSVPPPVSAGGQLSIKSIASVAAAGVASVSITNIADELLTFPTLPTMPEVHKSVQMTLPHSVTSNFNQKNIPVMILLDLLVSSGRTWEVCNHLMDAIKTRAPPNLLSSDSSQAEDQRYSLRKPKEHKIKGFGKFFTELESLLSLGVEEQFLRTEQTALSKLFHLSVQHFLCHRVHPLSRDKCREYALLYQNISKYVERVEEAFSVGHRQVQRNDSSPQSSPRQRKGSTGSLSSLRSARQDTPVLHHSMKQLIYALEKEVPAGGVISLISRSASDGQVKKNKSYLLSLYEHCKQLAYLVAESEATSRETMTVPKNYFQVLDEGPIRILGRMMFNKKMQPERLTKVAQSLSLNLTHIIVYSCCQRIPSKRLPTLPAGLAQSGYKVCNGTVVYNLHVTSVDTGGTVNNPEKDVRNILTRMVNLMKDFSGRCNAQGLFDYTSAEMMTKTAEYHDIIAQTHVLKNADLSHMSNPEKRCFYGNLQNLMTVHCFLQHIESQEAKEKLVGSEAGGEIRTCEMYKSMSDIDQITWLNKFSYQVGQLGIISLFHLKYVINRFCLRPPSEWGRALENRLMDLDESDPWHQMSPTPNPQLLFVQTSCCLSSAPLQILEPETVTEQLGSAMRTYLQMTVSVDRQHKSVRLPELLLWHRKDFLTDQQLLEYKAENEGLLKFIVSQLSGDKEKDLKELLSLDKHGKDVSNTELPFDIEVEPFCKEFLCVFDFPSLEHARQMQTYRDDSVEEPPSPSGSVSHMTYNLTPNTLSYVKENCPLVATLVSLVCSDEFDDIVEDFNEGHFNNSLNMSDSSLNRNRSPSAMSLVDIKSYRYEKLNDYQKLKHHLLNYIIPLAATEDQEILKGDDPILRLLTSEIIEKFKSTMLSLHESSEFNKMLSGLLNELFSHRKWTEIVKVIDSIPVMVLKQDMRLQSLHDFVLCCLIHNKCSSAEITLSRTKSEEVSAWIHKLMCPETQAREVLTVHCKLQIDHNIDLFELCLSSARFSDCLRTALGKRFEEIRVYHRITECAKNLQFRLSMKSSELISEEDKMAAKKRHLILDRFTQWANVVEWTRNSPREVLALLIKAGDYETAKLWYKLHSLPADIQQEIEENHIVSLLHARPANTTQAFLILEDIRHREVTVCLHMCKRFIYTLSQARDVVFVASYMLNELTSELIQEERDQLHLTHIGAQMLTCIPESMHVEYSHLISHPALLLEQLLMNMKPELAGKAYRTVSNEYDLISNPTHRFSVEDLNRMIATYAARALEIPVVQMPETLAEKERTMSKLSTASSDKLEDMAEHAYGSPQGHPSLMDSIQVKRRSVDLQGAPRLVSSAPSGSTLRRGMSPVVMENKFVMPAEPPSRDQWVPDAKASVCMVCNRERFSMFSRRHHCRRCGRVVCAACSSKTTTIRGVNSRTCDDCYHQIVKPNDRRGSTDDLLQVSRRSAVSPQAFSPESVISTIQEESDLSLSQVVSHVQTAWKLDTDDQSNQALREDFFFEQPHHLAIAKWAKKLGDDASACGLNIGLSQAMAPSTSVCISILDLHSNPRECGFLILKLCDDLSKYLRPIAPGVPNPEVDYSLIMSMMKYLLFHAKMKFIKCGENAGMARCDVYQSLVDLLGILVAAHFPDLPSIQELTKVDSVRRLRDKLISDERLPLAMEVSTKCGLDTAGVWVAWGMTCLQSGDFTAAREKFARCLKPPKDKNACTPGNKVLTDIIECLETMPGTGSMEIQILLTNPGSLKNLITSPASTFFEEASMDSQQFQECVYYLRTYSSYLSLIDFHRRHGYLMKAVQYILKQKCSVEVFIEGLLKPSLDAGELGKLTDQMLITDPTLERWGPYLTSACRYLVKLKLFHVLYDFQVFMKDFIRAGMTCFTYFYQENAQSYVDLYNHRQHLFSAQQHMQSYLDPSQWGGVPHPLSQHRSAGETTNVRLIKSTDEVKRFMKTIGLQIEVTQFLYECLTNRTGQAQAASVAVEYVGASKDSSIPTLFASSQVRTDLVIMVLLSGANLNLSFEMATRIIKEYKLGAVGIYTHVAREMAKSRRYGDMRGLFECVRRSGLDDPDTMDEIVGACLLVVADNSNQSEAKEAENIIKLLQRDSNKINAYILCGKLRSAYLMAVKEKRVEDVRRILRAAKSMGQTGVVSICTKWLEQEGHGNP